MDHEPALVVVDDSHKLVVRAELPRVSAPIAPMVLVTSAGLEYQGEPVVSNELAERLTATYEKRASDIDEGRARAGDADPRLVYLVIDERATWKRIVDVIATCSKVGYRSPSFVFRTVQTSPSPPPSWADAELDRIRKGDPSGRAQRFMEFMRNVVRPCSSIPEAWREATERGGDMTANIIEAIEPALVDCNCTIDLPALRTTLWRLFVNPRPAGVIRVELDPRGTKLTFPANTPWLEASQRFTPEMTQTSFGVSKRG
ncbi:MAG: ExbD/TolR family protein [Kofleriaceae bacterium]